MSADNEVALIKFAPDKFGVAHLVSFDHGFYKKDKEKYRELLLAACKELIFTNYAAADAVAQEIELDLEICEYGICFHNLCEQNRSILDFNVVHPGYEASGAEPTLRMLIFAYYAKHFDEKQTSQLANFYVNEIERRLNEKEI